MNCKHLVALAILCTSATVRATPCPTVMIVLDRSGSMEDPPSSSSSSTLSKMDIARTAIQALVQKYGNILPFGFTTFADDLSCNSGIDILVEPKHGTSADILTNLAATTPSGGTNTGQAVKKVAADPAMHDSSRPGSYMLLITDGEPFCSEGSLEDPDYTIAQIQAAASAASPVKTFVIGFGSLPADARDAMDKMADAGGEPCAGANCNGQKFYAADSAQALNDAIDAITQQISGEFGGTCDDSCYANGCPSVGEICVNGACKSDPCATIKNTCAPGDYCYTDGVSPGVCVSACPQPCAAGELCTLEGSCQADPCATASCPSGQVCHGGQCVVDQCSTGVQSGCEPGLICFQGRCQDDPCRYLRCPDGTECVPGTGACAAKGSSGTGDGGVGGGPRNRGSSGCDFGGSASSAGLLGLGLAALGLRLARRRRA